MQKPTGAPVRRTRIAIVARKGDRGRSVEWRPILPRFGSNTQYNRVRCAANIEVRAAQRGEREPSLDEIRYRPTGRAGVCSARSGPGQCGTDRHPDYIQRGRTGQQQSGQRPEIFPGRRASLQQRRHDERHRGLGLGLGQSQHQCAGRIAQFARHSGNRRRCLRRRVLRNRSQPDCGRLRYHAPLSRHRHRWLRQRLVADSA